MRASGAAGSTWQLGAGRTAAGRGPDRGQHRRPTRCWWVAGAGSCLDADAGLRPARVRADAGYFDATLAHVAVQLGCDFAVAAKRNSAAWRALSAVPDSHWRQARGMHGAQVAACDYAPAGWPDGTYTIIRRVKISIDKLSADPRLRRRRTVAKDQLALALGGAATTSGPSASSSPTSPPTTATWSGWKRGSATALRSRNASVRSSTAVG